MSVEIIAALIAVGASVICGLIAWMAKSLISNLSRTALEAINKAHALEVLLLEHKAKQSDNLRVVEVAFLEYKIYVGNEYVRRGDHSAILSEIFRKIETIDNKLDARLAKLDERMNDKQDKGDRRNTDTRGS